MYLSLYMLFLTSQNYRNGEHASYVEEEDDMDVSSKNMAVNLPGDWGGVFLNCVFMKGLVLLAQTAE